jgi:hypothetical protein
MSNLQYRNQAYKKHYESILERLKTRSDFDPNVHLVNLDILAKLWSERERLEDVLEIGGEWQINPHTRFASKRPEKVQLHQTLDKIHRYSCLLGMGLSSGNRIIKKATDKKSKEVEIEVLQEEWK